MRLPTNSWSMSDRDLNDPGTFADQEWAEEAMPPTKHWQPQSYVTSQDTNRASCISYGLAEQKISHPVRKTADHSSGPDILPGHSPTQRRVVTRQNLPHRRQVGGGFCRSASSMPTQSPLAWWNPATIAAD